MEPFYDNIVRIHKAASTENIQTNIKLITNAISNKRNQVKRLTPDTNNIGGQSLLNDKKQDFNREDMPKDKYLVETILFDDLVEHLPRKKDNKRFTQAILKIDIEGMKCIC